MVEVCTENLALLDVNRFRGSIQVHDATYTRPKPVRGHMGISH